MPTPAQRMSLLLRVHGDSYRNAAELCSLDHTTIMRVDRGETESPATLARIAESYGVPADWMRGGADLATDFTFAVLLRPIRDRVRFLWEPERRLGFALKFLADYAPAHLTIQQLAQNLQIEESYLVGILAREEAHLPATAIERLAKETGLPYEWLRTGMIGREDEEELLVGLAEWALSTLAEAVGVKATEDTIHGAAVALV